MNSIIPTILLLVAFAAPSPPAEAEYRDALYRLKILGDLEGALAALDRASGLEPPPDLAVRVLARRVLCLWSLERDDAAEEAYRRLPDPASLRVAADVRNRLEDFATFLKLKELKARTVQEREEHERELEALRRGEPETPVVSVPATSEKGPDYEAKLLERAREDKERSRAISKELVAKARRLETEGDNESASLYAQLALEEDPGNIVAREMVRQLGRSRMNSADLKRAVEFEQVTLREMAVRKVDDLLAAAKESWAVGKHRDVANLAGAVLEIRYRFPDLAELLIDRVDEAMRLVRRAEARGARPDFVPKGEDGWLENIYEILRAVEKGRDTERRTYALYKIQQRAREDAPEPAVRAAIARVTRAEEYPTRALVELVKGFVAPDTWDGEERSLGVVENLLGVRHTKEVQAEVRRFLWFLTLPPRAPERIGFDLVVLPREELTTLTSVIAIPFVSRGSVVVATLDAIDLAAWGRRTRWARRIARPSGETKPGRPIRLDATKPELATVGFRPDVLGGRAVSLPVVREVLQGARLDAIVLPRKDGSALIGLEGFVSLIGRPTSIHTPDGELLQQYSESRQEFRFAETAPARGALLITGLPNPFEPRSDDEVLCLLVAPGGLPALGAPGLIDAEGGVVISDLAEGEDAPGPAFFQEFSGLGPARTHSTADLVTLLLAERGLEVESRSGVLHATGERREEGRRILSRLLAARENLFEIRARAVVQDGGGPEAGPAIEVESDAAGRAWLASADAPPLPGTDRLTVGRLTAGSLQCVHLGRVETNAFVEHYESRGGGLDSRAQPVFGSVGRGLVLEVRAVADGDAVALSLLIRTASLRSIAEIRFGSEEASLPMSFPDQVVERVRIRTRLASDRKLVVADLPDPFGAPGAKLIVELQVRRISR